MLQISPHITIPDSEIEIHAMRSQGAGGQLQFSVQEVQQIRENLSTKMVQIQLGDNAELRIIDCLLELQ